VRLRPMRVQKVTVFSRARVQSWRANKLPRGEISIVAYSTYHYQFRGEEPKGHEKLVIMASPGFGDGCLLLSSQTHGPHHKCRASMLEYGDTKHPLVVALTGFPPQTPETTLTDNPKRAWKPILVNFSCQPESGCLVEPCSQ
jgi:hypothetical protein